MGKRLARGRRRVTEFEALRRRLLGRGRPGAGEGVGQLQLREAVGVRAGPAFASRGAHGDRGALAVARERVARGRLGRRRGRRRLHDDVAVGVRCGADARRAEDGPYDGRAERSSNVHCWCRGKKGVLNRTWKQSASVSRGNLSEQVFPSSTGGHTGHTALQQLVICFIQAASASGWCIGPRRTIANRSAVLGQYQPCCT